MIFLKSCDKCGYRHGDGRCCIDIYQQLGRTKGPPIWGLVMLAFGLPLLFFIGSLVLAQYLLSGLMSKSGMRMIAVFLAALAATLVFVQIIRVSTRKPINTEHKTNNETGTIF
jgi:hypothetical protein